MSERPGVMLYFQDFDPAERLLTDTELGRLFRGIMRYAGNGELPDFGDSVPMQLIWGFVRPKIDRDAQKYEESVERSRFGVYKREAQKRGESLLSFDEWREKQAPSMSPSSPIMGAYPNVTGKVNATATATGKVNATATATGTATANSRGDSGGNDWEESTPFDFEKSRSEKIAALIGYGKV